jgi:hypothetical protein
MMRIVNDVLVERQKVLLVQISGDETDHELEELAKEILSKLNLQ